MTPPHTNGVEFEGVDFRKAAVEEWSPKNKSETHAPEKPQSNGAAKDAGRLERLEKSYAAGRTRIGKFDARKPTSADMAILNAARNRFLAMTREDLERVFPNGTDPEACRREGTAFIVDSVELFAFAPDVVEWVLVCTSSREKRAEWYADPKKFKTAAFEFADEVEFDPDELGEAFAKVFELLGEINRSRVQPKKEFQGAGKGRGPGGKKKRRRSSRRSR